MKVRKAVFPVAGLGTRFLPATKAMPKEMLPNDILAKAIQIIDLKPEQLIGTQKDYDNILENI